jgi:hypothetical protein
MAKCDRHIDVNTNEWCWKCQELTDNERFESIRSLQKLKETEKIKVIFLDIDGVLNVIPIGHDEFGGIFHTKFVDNLKRIIDETGAKIVISSTWRFGGLQRMKDMWKFRELPGEVIDITIDCYELIKEGRFEYYDEVERGHEIQEWIDTHPNIENYVILDDDNDFLPNQRGNFVRTSNNINHPDCVDIGYGLTKECTNKAIRILNR